MKNFEIKNVDCHASLAVTKSVQSGRSLLPICKADAPLFLSDVYNKRYMSEKITSRCPQSGRSMIEMLGVLAIIGVLSVGGIAGYSKAMMKYRINKTIEQITLIAGNVRAFWGPQKNYDGVRCSCDSAGCSGQSSNDGCPIHKKAKIFPDEMITVTDGKIMSITNPFGGEVELALWSDFGIAYYLPNNEEICIELVSQDWTVSGATRIELTDTEDEALTYINIPSDLDTAITRCSAVVEANKRNDTDGVKMTLDFDK